MGVANISGICEEWSAVAILARCSAAAVRNGRPAPIALEAGVGLLRDYYERNPEVSVAETAARCARLLAAHPLRPDAAEIDWRSGYGRACAVLGVLMSNVLGSLVETDGSRFDPHRATALYFRALSPRATPDQVLAGRGRWARWSVRLTRVSVLALRLSEHCEFDRDRFVELFFEIASLEAVARLCRRAANAQGRQPG